MSMKLAILGLLMESDSHPYELRQKMKEQGMQYYMKIQDGSLYYAMDQLRKDEYIEAVETLRDGNRPDKTIFRITDAGKQLFQELIKNEMKHTVKITHPVCAALAFAKYGDQEILSTQLEDQIQEMEKLASKMKNLHNHLISKADCAQLHIIRSYYEHAETELRWLQSLRLDALEGRLGMAASSLNIQPIS